MTGLLTRLAARGGTGAAPQMDVAPMTPPLKPRFAPDGPGESVDPGSETHQPNLAPATGRLPVENLATASVPHVSETPDPHDAVSEESRPEKTPAQSRLSAADPSSLAKRTNTAAARPTETPVAPAALIVSDTFAAPVPEPKRPSANPFFETSQVREPAGIENKIKSEVSGERLNLFSDEIPDQDAKPKPMVETFAKPLDELARSSAPTFGRSPAAPAPDQTGAHAERADVPGPTLNIGRINVVFEQPPMPRQMQPTRRTDPDRTRGFDGYGPRRLGRRR